MSDGLYKGIAPMAGLVGVKVLDDKGKGRLSDMLEGIKWIKKNRQILGIQVVNISVGSLSRQNEKSLLIQAIDDLWDDGCIICAAAGNEGTAYNNITSPGISRKIITVGSSNDEAMVDAKGKLHINYSGRGPTQECICKPEIVAPGTAIISTNAISEKNPEPYSVKSGTSMSTPVVSGVTALIREKYPDISNKNVKLLLWKTAKDIKLPINHQGWGLVNADIESI